MLQAPDISLEPELLPETAAAGRRQAAAAEAAEVAEAAAARDAAAEAEAESAGDASFWRALRRSTGSSIDRKSALKRTRNPDDGRSGWHVALQLPNKGLRCRDGEPVAQWLRRGGRNAVDAVELAGNSLGAAGLRQLAAALTDPGCGRLATLDLSANEICLIAAR